MTAAKRLLARLALALVAAASGCSSEVSEQRMVCLPAATTCPSRAEALDAITKKNSCAPRRSDVRVDEGPVPTSAGCCYLVTVTSHEPDLDVCIASSERPLRVDGHPRTAGLASRGEWRRGPAEDVGPLASSTMARVKR